MNLRPLCAAVAGLCALLAAPWSKAAAPPVIPLQGYVTDASDAPLNGAHSMTFTLYTSSAGVSAVHAESQGAVSVQQGRFLAYLGANSASPLDLALFRDNAELWLEVIVDGTHIIQPRFRLGSLPYAGFSAYCNEAPSVQGKAASAFAPKQHTHAWEVNGTVQVLDVPTEWIDGDNDTLANLSCPQGNSIQSTGNQAMQCAALPELVPDTVMFFDLSVCPAGWSEYDAARGRAIVPAPAGGTIGATVGATPLTNQQVLSHTHTIDLSAATVSLAHNHGGSATAQTSLAGAHDHHLGASIGIAAWPSIFCFDPATAAAASHQHTSSTNGEHQHSFTFTVPANPDTHTHTYDAAPFATGPADSPVPYIQYLACIKD